MTSYRLNPAAFREELLKSEFMAAEVEAHAERIRAVAEATSPVDTGQYASSFRVESTREGGIHRDRVSASVVNDDPAALSIEFGHVAPDGRVVPGHYTLTRALDAAG